MKKENQIANISNQQLLQAIHEVKDAVGIFSQYVSERFDRLELRMDSMERRMDSLELRMDSLESRMDNTETKAEARFARIESRLDKIENNIETVQVILRKVDGDVDMLLSEMIVRKKIVELESL